MFTTVRQYRGDPGATAEVAHTVDERFADVIAAEPGFVAYEMMDCGDGQFCTISVFTDRDAAERSNDLAAEFVRANLAHLEITRESAMTGEVLVNRARSEMMEMVHA
jgi:quinol monooxygenase YgiN